MAELARTASLESFTLTRLLDVTKLAPAEQYPETPVEKKDGYDIKLLSKCRILQHIQGER